MKDTGLSADISAYSLIIPAAITVAGWFYVGRAADEREFRKELRERLQAVRECVEDVQKSACDYWIDGALADAPACAIRLKSNIKRLSMQVSILNIAGLDYDGSDTVGLIRQAATGGSFEQKGRRKNAKIDAERVAEAVSLLEELLQNIELAFYRRFPPVIRKRDFRKLASGFGFLALSSDS